jgi:uncharacterized membrane protein
MAAVPTRSGAASLVEVNRLEAFSDGVFAIAVTLLVLELRVPRLEATAEGTRLLPALLAQWPSYLAFVTSFATILIMWINHHTLFKIIRGADHGLFLINGLMLLVITIVPFPTALVAEHVLHPGQTVATAVYTGHSIIIALVYNLLWWYIAHHRQLLRPHLTPAQVRRFSRQYLIGPLLYLIAFSLSFVNVLAALGLCLALAIFFALPSVLTGPTDQPSLHP